MSAHTIHRRRPSYSTALLPHPTALDSFPTGLIPRTLGPFNVFYSSQRLDLFAWCARLSRLLVDFRTHLKSINFHFISEYLEFLD